MSDPPPIPEPLWDTVPPEAQAASRRCSRPWSGGSPTWRSGSTRTPPTPPSPPPPIPPSVKRRPPAPASGKKRGGQPGHRRQARPLVPPEQLRQVIECKPPECRWCGHAVARRRPRADPAPGRRSAAGPARGGRVPAPSPDAAPAAAPRPVRPCRRACPPGRSAPGCGPSSASWPGATAWASGRSASWPSTCSGLSISIGMICRLERQAAAELEAPVEELRQYVRDAAVGPHRRDLVVAGPGQDVALGGRDEAGDGLHDRHRPGGPRSPGACWGPTASKVVISDRFKSYAWIKRRQFCWAHLRSGFPGDDRPGRRVRRGRSAAAGPLRAAVRLVAPGAGRDAGPGHASGPTWR